MKLFFVISSLQGGGAEGVMVSLANELAYRNHHVTLVTTYDPHVYHVNDNVNLVEARLWRYDTSYGSYPIRTLKKIANRFKDYRHLKNLIKDERPDLIMSFLTQWLTNLLLICKGKVPLIFADRNAAEFKFDRHDFFIRRVLFSSADVVQVMSYYDAAFLHKRYKKVVPMPNPLRFKPLTKDLFDAGFEKRRNILAVGRLAPQKGFDKLIEAFAKVADKYPEWDVDICGQDMVGKSYSFILKKVVTDYNLEDRIHFIGFHKDIDKLMQEHSIFCLSSIHEGFPNVLTEAMANGMACLSFDIVTGPHEIIIDGLDGMIVDNQSVDSLAEGMDILMGDGELRRSFGSHAIENIKRFNKDKVVDKWEKLFASTIKSFLNDNN